LAAGLGVSAMISYWNVKISKSVFKVVVWSRGVPRRSWFEDVSSIVCYVCSEQLKRSVSSN
jgi:hypothetical protein